MIQGDAVGTTMVLMLAGIYAFVNYIKGIKEKAQGPTPPPVPGTQRPGAPPRLYQDEAERERRFLEALGMPAKAEPKQRKDDPMRQSMSASPRRNPSPAPAPAALPPRLPRTAPPPIRKREFPTLPPLQTTETPAWRNLETPEVPLFETVSSRIEAAPEDDPSISEGAHAFLSTERRGDTFLDLLRDRANLRSAILLREILGPPRGLPSAGDGPSFPIS